MFIRKVQIRETVPQNLGGSPAGEKMRLVPK